MSFVRSASSTEVTFPVLESGEYVVLAKNWLLIIITATIKLYNGTTKTVKLKINIK